MSLFSRIFERIFSGAKTPAPTPAAPALSRVPEAVRREYLGLFSGLEIRAEKRAEAEKWVRLFQSSRLRYEAVAKQTGIPAWFVWALHVMEGGGSFTTHLHNGDPLRAKTVHVPKARPVLGQPPYTWEQSAVDALTRDDDNPDRASYLVGWGDWSLPGALYAAEKYNGMGYRNRVKPPIPSPYLWAGTNRQVRGKYRADGVYDPALWSEQTGVAALLLALLLALVERGILSF